MPTMTTVIKPVRVWAFMLWRTAASNAVRGFPQRDLLYFEDADLLRKVQESGWRTMYRADAAAVHQWRRFASHSDHHMCLFCVSEIRHFNKCCWRVW